MVENQRFRHSNLSYTQKDACVSSSIERKKERPVINKTEKAMMHARQQAITHTDKKLGIDRKITEKKNQRSKSAIRRELVSKENKHVKRERERERVKEAG